MRRNPPAPSPLPSTSTPLSPSQRTASATKATAIRCARIGWFGRAPNQLACVHSFELGIACLRTSDFSVELSAFCDDQAYSKCLSVLTRHEPSQVLFPPGAREGGVLERIVVAEFPHAHLVQVPRSSWNEIKGAVA